jgi:hypothetical protein
MSAEGLKKFVTALKNDAAMGDHFAAAVAAFAVKNGFDVTAAEVQDAVAPASKSIDPYYNGRARDWDDMFYGNQGQPKPR